MNTAVIERLEFAPPPQGGFGRAGDVGIVADRGRQRAAPALGDAMSGLAFLIPVALLLGLGGLAAFLWALRSGQFDDLDGAALRILIDDEPAQGEDR